VVAKALGCNVIWQLESSLRAKRGNLRRLLRRVPSLALGMPHNDI
jgi:uncharacterized protein YlxP (DUF503 family)